MWVVVIDTETTGLVHHFACPVTLQPEIIQFYGVVVNLETGEQGYMLSTFVQPTKTRTPEVIKETRSKISNKQLEQAPLFSAVAPAIFSFLEMDGIEAVIAHNIAFDMRMLNVECERLGEVSIRWPRPICTMEQTGHLAGRRMTLSRLYEHLFGERFAEAHLADKDTAALVRISVELWKRGIIS